MEEHKRKIDETDALVRQTVKRLSKSYSPDQVGQIAQYELLDLKPHLQKALGSLAIIEAQRSLTDDELARRRAFKTLLAAALL